MSIHHGISTCDSTDSEHFGNVTPMQESQNVCHVCHIGKLTEIIFVLAK